MLSICICILVLAEGVKLERIDHPFGAKSPITSVVTDKGKGGQLRVISLEAKITPDHLKTKMHFPRTGKVQQHFLAVKSDGDERGHLLGAQFSGPPDILNLSPQSPVVNRNEGYQALTTDWYNTECEVAEFLGKGGDKDYVSWKVTMSYDGDSNRPKEYHLQVDKVSEGKSQGAIDTKLGNPLQSQQKKGSFWVCGKCRSNKCDKMHLH